MASSTIASQHAIKSYRYLRIAIVAVVAALVFALFYDRIFTDNPELGSISAYHYTAVGPLFVGALIMIGVCLIAIRGTYEFEETVLNLAGILAPIVALVPTGCPGGLDFCSDFATSETYVRVGFVNPNVVAVGLAGVLAILTTYVLARLLSKEEKPERSVRKTVVLRFVTAAVLVVAIWATDRIWGPQGPHNAAAIGLIAGLWVVATANAVRRVPGEEGRSESLPEWRAAAGGTLGIAGVALVVLGFWRVFASASGGWLMVGLGLLCAVAFALSSSLRKGVRDYVHVLSPDADRYSRNYLLLAATMMLAGPGLALVPLDIPDRTFWIELFELLPFGLFWVIQTIEYWNEGVVDRAVTVGRPPGQLSTSR